MRGVRFPTELDRESLERIAELAEEDGLQEEAVDPDELLPRTFSRRG